MTRDLVLFNLSGIPYSFSSLYVYFSLSDGVCSGTHPAWEIAKPLHIANRFLKWLHRVTTKMCVHSPNFLYISSSRYSWTPMLQFLLHDSRNCVYIAPIFCTCPGLRWSIKESLFSLPTGKRPCAWNGYKALQDLKKPWIRSGSYPGNLSDAKYLEVQISKV